MNKIIIFISLILAISLLAGCGQLGDGIDDLYTKNIYPSVDSTYQLGTDTNRYADGYFDDLHVSPDTLYVGDLTLAEYITENGGTQPEGVTYPFVWLGTYETAPSNPEINNAYRNSVDKKSYIWDGALWQIITMDGQDGTNGTDGIDGYTPIKGVDYFDGTNGTDGYTPIKGIDYFDGVDGLSINWHGAYDNGHSYVLNDAVSYNGSAYICKLVTVGNLPTNTAYWDLIASKGDTGSNGINGTDGTDGLSVVWHGAYDGGHAYIVNDAVSYNGSSYICILNSTGNLPTNSTYWNLLASKGDNGISNISTSTTTDGTGYLKGNGANISFDNSTYITSFAYTLEAHAASQSTTTDGQTMYWGSMLVAPSTTANRWRIYIPQTGSIVAVYIFSYAGTAGTGENWSMYIRYDNATDTLIQTLGAATNDRVWSNTNLNISVTQGHYIEIKEIQPTWGTNPATVTRAAIIYIQRTGSAK